MRMLTILCMAGFLSPATGEAADSLLPRSDPRHWIEFHQQCDDFLVPGFKELTAKWKSWQEKANKTVKAIVKHADKTCPAYYQRKQGEEALPAFVAENSRVSLLAAQTGKEGRPISRFLDDKFRFFDSDAKANGFEFTANKCGKTFAERRAFIAKDLAHMEKLILGLEKKCDGKFQQDAKVTVARKLASLPRNPQVKAKGKPNARVSTITGKIKSRQQAKN